MLLVVSSCAQALHHQVQCKKHELEACCHLSLWWHVELRSLTSSSPFCNPVDDCVFARNQENDTGLTVFFKHSLWCRVDYGAEAVVQWLGLAHMNSLDGTLNASTKDNFWAIFCSQSLGTV